MSAKSEELYEIACRYIPGGVNSPVRAFRAVGGRPLFISRAKGSKIYDADGREFIDYVGSWGPAILGHAHPVVVDVLKSAAELGSSFGAPTDLEVELARMIVEAVPSIEMVRMVNSGTEAAMSAIRVARGYTGRDKIVKFDGCYHGHADSLLVKAGSGAITFGVPDSRGVPADIVKNTITLPYNDFEALEGLFKSQGEEIACLIMEPVAGNMGVVPPNRGFLELARDLTRKCGALLIFDEVITGFRLAYGGAQQRYNVMPDLTCLGKIVGGGLPVGAYGGKKEIMEMVAPLGPVYQAGTLSGNPLAMAAGVATLKVLSTGNIYDMLEARSSKLCQRLAAAAEEAGVPVSLNRVGSMFSIFFTGAKVSDYNSAKRSDTALFEKFFKGFLSRGCYIAPSQFESWFLSIAHDEEDFERTVEACGAALKAL